MNKIIPLFPLSLVVYPGSIYPLHIFEEKYKKLVARCIDKKDGFGIIPIIEKESAKIGCYVNIERIIQKFDNGSFDIWVKGVSRFILIETWIHNDGYSEGKITEYNDIRMNAPSRARIISAVDIFKNILQKVDITLEDDFWDSLEHSEYKSFKLAEKSGLNIRQQVDLLKIQSESQRISFLIDHFERIYNYLDKNLVNKNLIAGDGYINIRENF